MIDIECIETAVIFGVAGAECRRIGLDYDERMKELKLKISRCKQQKVQEIAKRFNPTIQKRCIII